MSYTYFSVDVEATSTSLTTGELLTIGCVKVSSSGLVHGSDFYVRIELGYFPDSIGSFMPPPRIDPSTHQFWLDQAEQSPKAYEEIFNRDYVRVTPRLAAQMLAEYVTNHGHADPANNIFVANPTSYDYPWIDHLFTSQGVPNPFSYRTLCLRSAWWGRDRRVDPTKSVRGHKSAIPHHALEDARAQALDLRDLILAHHRTEDSPSESEPA